MFLTLKRLSGRTGSARPPLYQDEDREEDRSAAEEGELLPGEPGIGRAPVEEPEVEKRDPAGQGRESRASRASALRGSSTLFRPAREV